MQRQAEELVMYVGGLQAHCVPAPGILGYLHTILNHDRCRGTILQGHFHAIIV